MKQNFLSDEAWGENSKKGNKSVNCLLMQGRVEKINEHGNEIANLYRD
jgi:hypothetical protein